MAGLAYEARVEAEPRFTAEQPAAGSDRSKAWGPAFMQTGGGPRLCCLRFGRAVFALILAAGQATGEVQMSQLMLVRDGRLCCARDALSSKPGKEPLECAVRR